MEPLKHGTISQHQTLESLASLSGNKDPGNFGRMFPKLPPLQVSDVALEALASAMIDSNHGSADGDNDHIPAGYTYFGQFVDHDITRDVTPLSDRDVDVANTRNFRSPSLDLDSVYGGGPDISPHLYARDPDDLKLTAKLLIGKTVTGQGDPSIPPDLPNDLPRNAHGRALIGDERNDENLLVAQTHLLFLKFHNAVVDFLESQINPPKQVFAEAQRLVRWHYQWIVLYDFVERLTEDGIINRIRHEGRKFYRFKKTPYIPVEFSVAAYRLGHSMVREEYNFNRVFRPGGLVPASLDLLFRFTGKSGTISGDLASGGNPESLPSDWIVDWRRFFDLGTPQNPPDLALNPSRKLDPAIAPALHTLPGEAGGLASLPFRNLQRGVNNGLPSGQDVSSAMRLPVLSPAEIATGPDGEAAKDHGLHECTPLWYYILKEAEVKGGGKRLGPTGSRILAEVFLGLVHGDQSSFLWQRSNWKPELPSSTAGDFTMADLIEFVGDINPIGN